MTPAVTLVGSSIWVTWPDRALTLEFSRIDEHRDTITAEIAVTHTELGELHWSRSNLLAAQARAHLVKACETVLPDAYWRETVDVSCREVVRRLRQGEPSIRLAAAAPEPAWVADRWLVPGLIPRGQTSLLYADGGSGKSLLALALAVSGILGAPISSRWAVGHVARCLYLDWESDAEDHAGRLWSLTAGREPVPDGTVLYRRMYRPMTDHADQLHAEADREGIDLVILDSLGAACGSEPESADAAVRTLMALRALSATRLVLAHVSKAQADGEGPRRPYGSVYVQNLARSAIEVRGEADGDELALSLFHRKANMGKLAPPSGLTFAWDSDGKCHITGARADLSSAKLPARVLQALSGQKQTVTELADALGEKPDVVRVTLNRLENRNKVVRLVTVSGGKGHETQWGRADTNRNTDEE